MIEHRKYRLNALEILTSLVKHAHFYVARMQGILQAKVL